MTNFITQFKTKAKNKSLTSADMLALAIYKTINAKSEDKEVVLHALIKKAFTAGKICAHRNFPYQAVSDAAYRLRFQTRPGRRYNSETKSWVEQLGEVLGVAWSEIMTEEQFVDFSAKVEYVQDYGAKDLRGMFNG